MKKEFLNYKILLELNRDIGDLFVNDIQLLAFYAREKLPVLLSDEVDKTITKAQKSIRDFVRSTEFLETDDLKNFESLVKSEEPSPRFSRTPKDNIQDSLDQAREHGKGFIDYVLELPNTHPEYPKDDENWNVDVKVQCLSGYELYTVLKGVETIEQDFNEVLGFVKQSRKDYKAELAQIAPQTAQNNTIDTQDDKKYHGR